MEGKAEGSDHKDAKFENVDLKIDLHPMFMAESEMTKVTSVRKGMGKAKYSSLITTVPSEMCKALGIVPGDSLMWMVKKGSGIMAVSKLPHPETLQNNDLIYTVMALNLEKETNSDTRTMLEGMKSLMESMGPVRKLSDDEFRRELKRYLVAREAMGKKGKK